MAIKPVTLWSWLIKSETKEEFRCPPGLQVTNETFASELARQIQVNSLPAQVELCEVNWDDTNTKQTRALVRYTGSDARTDVVRLLVGVDQMGNFAYVERKTFLRPPHLPIVPRAKKAVPESKQVSIPKEENDSGEKGCLRGFLNLVLVVTIGAIATLGGIAFESSIALIVIASLASLIAGFAIYQANKQSNEKQAKAQAEARAKLHAAREEYERKVQLARNEVEAWNRNASEEQKAWESAWSNWQSEVVQAAYLSMTDDVFGRFTSAISSTVDDVVKVLFVDRNAELRNRTQHAQTQEEIEKELERRRSEAFK